MDRNSGKPLHIILVEDDDVDAEAITRAFRAIGVAARTTRFVDGRAAIDALDKDTVLTASRRLTKSALPKRIRSSVDDPKALTDEERYKIKCAQKHYAALGVELQYHAPRKDWQSFLNGVRI